MHLQMSIQISFLSKGRVTANDVALVRSLSSMCSHVVVELVKVVKHNAAHLTGVLTHHARDVVILELAMDDASKVSLLLRLVHQN